MNIDKSNIRSVYSGVEGKCCCGCSGKYYSAESKHMINKVCNIIESKEEGELDHDSSYVAAVIGKRVYIVYFKDWQSITENQNESI